MAKTRLLGLCLTLLGAGMFFFGVSMFTYQGNNLSPLISKADMLFFCTVVTDNYCWGRSINCWPAKEGNSIYPEAKPTDEV